ncbi:MAG: hypothetical protein DWQ01_09235 [Planctomycetota bacterium]|nr:MAG: hypothetical protein DWQ01_09235 [Planctomycetota bacterium]
MPDPSMKSTSGCCSSKDGGDLNRRSFLQAAAALAAGSLDPGSPTAHFMAGPFFSPSNQDGPWIPADKKLSPGWRAALTAKGEAEWLRGEALRFIGMPIGGVACGQLYLSGDGRLWRWEIFKSNDHSDYGGMSMGIHYAKPPEPGKDPWGTEVEQGFALRIHGTDKEEIRPMNISGWRDVAFRGEYPLAKIRYRDAGAPVEVDLEAGSPFVPLEAELSALPLTVFRFKVRNSSGRRLKVDLAGWLQNAVCPYEGVPAAGRRENRIIRTPEKTSLACSATPPLSAEDKRPDLVLADFEDESYGGWKAEGTAFGNGPFHVKDLEDYHQVSGYQGVRFVNSHQTRAGEDVREGDAHTGSLTSPEFKIERNYLTFRIGGGRHPERTEVQLWVGDRIVQRATGHDGNAMRQEIFSVKKWIGRKARIRIVDAVTGPWGNIGADHFVQSDAPKSVQALASLDGFGSMALTLLGKEPAFANANLSTGDLPQSDILWKPGASYNSTDFGTKPIGGLGRSMDLDPGETGEWSFILSWHFQDYQRVGGELASLQNVDRLRRHYASRFQSALQVAGAYHRLRAFLESSTQSWNRCWYDSTLPVWLLDRSFLSLDCLATQTCHWFDDGRFYGWEGVDCCPGTCQHVWQYAQGLARIFPRLERNVRDQVDFGLAWNEDGRMDYRGEAHRGAWATDGAAGTIVRAFREHQMSPDGRFLARRWPRIKRSLQFLMDQDQDRDGLLEGRQYNTLDQAWYGPMAWISSLFLAAVACGAEMAKEMKDFEFAEQCQKLLNDGRASLVKRLYNGEYFIHIPDPKHPQATNTNDGCHIDQVLGQSFAWQVGLQSRIVPKKETESALHSLWRYNFAPDAGAYRQQMQELISGGRWYAMEGEAGLVMCTWPKGGVKRAPGKGNSRQVFIGYFNECMNGFEYQVASHMIYEGEPGSELVEKGLAVTRAIHDRYHPQRRNPWNEIECSDHYARSMASYGVYLAACGFEYHGPKGHMGFAPKIRPEHFRAAFTAAEGWGSYWQRHEAGNMRAGIEVRYGSLRLTSLRLQLPSSLSVTEVVGTMGGSHEELPLSFQMEESRRCRIKFPTALVLHPGKPLELKLA